MKNYPNPSTLKTFEEEECAYCSLKFTRNQGRCSTAEFPGEVFHVHCVKLFKDDNEAIYHGDESTVDVRESEAPKKEPLLREIFTKGKKKNAKALSV